MSLHSVAVECPVPKSFRVDQVRGMFDLKAEKVARQCFDVDLPGEDEDWQIGVIVGPSGSGKSTVARSAYGNRFVEKLDWPREAAVVDGFDQKTGAKDIASMLTSVGFSSPPSWVKPYHVLSGGERFRCDLARALLAPGELVAFDEFTSVVDRNVAQIGSAAVSKAIRKGRIAKKFVAVTCHYDILEWLEPDWVLDMATQQLARGCLYHRPTIELHVAPVHRSAWVLFRRHHYLNTELSPGSKCFVAFWGNEPVAFSAWLTSVTRGKKSGGMREHRTVVLPDFQGVGIGNRLSEMCASIFRGTGVRASSTTSHPGMIHYRSASPLWNRKRFGRVAPIGSSSMLARAAARRGKKTNTSIERITAGFEFVGPAMDGEMARRFLDARPDIWLPLGATHHVVHAIRRSATTTKRLAALTGYSTTRIWNVLMELEPLGYLERIRRGKSSYAIGLTPAGRAKFFTGDADR